MRTIVVLMLALATGIGAQTKVTPKSTQKIQVCVKDTKAYGSYVRFTPEEHVQILLHERNARVAQDWPYRQWEMAASSINWFDGVKPVSLAYVKSHMPRAMLLNLRFPVDPNPKIVQADIDRLLEAEKNYNESAKAADAIRAYLRDLLKKYGIGPVAILDADMGGATPQSDCERYEDQEWPSKP